MNNPVPHSDNLRPRDIRVALLGNWGDSSSSFAHYPHQVFPEQVVILDPSPMLLRLRRLAIQLPLKRRQAYPRD